MIGSALRDRPAVLLGLLGLVSGLASAFVDFGFDLRPLQPIAYMFLLHASLLPIGVYFAAAMAIGLWLLSQRAGASAIAFLVTLYAWSGAVHIAIRTQRHVGDEEHLLAASLAAGAFGAGLTHLGASLALPQLRRWRAVAATIATGATVALLFYLGERGFIDKRVLFVFWQPAVALAIGLSAGGPTSDRR